MIDKLGKWVVIIMVLYFFLSAAKTQFDLNALKQVESYEKQSVEDEAWQFDIRNATGRR